jgi:serine/threonine protein kinase/tetratricopeptide (TPR) repeat protein
MAEVWRALHVPQQLPVAVKVITQAAGRDPLFLRVFRNEVRSVARLDHPGIIMVLDYGEVPEDAERASDGRIAAKSPYIAMELASWGSLDRLKATLEWTDLSRILLSLLDALAHAHARGVLHRDLKPGNVLVSTHDDLRPGIKLTDFGIAHALDQDENRKSLNVAGGTPLFMAPEQFVGEWREFGPWTDLYAVGCLTYFFATGKPPFAGDNTMALGVQHIRQPPPPFLPYHPMPKGLEAWVLRLLAKDPGDRFQRAADAAYGLARLRDDDLEASGPGRIIEIPFSATVPTTLPWIAGANLLENVTPAEDTVRDRDPPMTPEHPPLPFSWHAPPRSPPPPKLVGAGLGLYGIRKVPLVDRDAERDLLWRTLARVRSEGRAELVLISGAAGTGKSRLAEWFCERADEVGGATVLKAYFGPMRSPSEAIGLMLARYFRATDLDRVGVKERVERMLRRSGVDDEYEWNALTEMISRAPSRDPTHTSGVVQFTTAVERPNLILRFLSRVARDRPLVVWFDDVQWGADALVYARHLLDAQEDDPHRVLVVATARDDILAARPMESELVDEILSRAGTARLAIPPLRYEDQQTLIHELLGLQQSLATEIALRTAGNPLFAVQLVDDWVTRGVLELDGSGFKLVDGEAAELPSDVRQVWMSQIDDLLEGEPAEAIVALELAAILGGEVHEEEWCLACELYGISIPPSLTGSLVDHRLLYASDHRVSFAHNMLRESLEEHARDRLRYEAHHRLCASMLEERYGADNPIVSERIGRHYLEGGSYAEALTPLFIAALERWRISDYGHAQLLLDDYERTLASLAASNADARWSDCWVLRARIANMQGRYKEAITWSERARDHARYFKLERPLAEALRERGMVASALGDIAEASALLHESENLLEAAGDRDGLALCHLAIAQVLLFAGHLKGARERFRRAQERFREGGEWIGMAQALHGLGVIARSVDDADAARLMFEQELELSERTGNRHARARALAALADVDRDTGDLATADRRYRDALEIHLAIGSGESFRVRVGLALLLLEAGDTSQADRELQTVRPLLEAMDEPIDLCRVRAALAASAAASGDFREFESQLAEARAVLEATPIVDVTFTRTLELAHDLAARSGRPDLATEARDMADRLRRAVIDPR